VSTTESIIVRCARPEDAHAVSVARTIGDWWPYKRPKGHVCWPAPVLTGPHKQCQELVAEVDGRVVGRVYLEAIYPPFGELINLSVLPAYRGRGVGGALVDGCLAELARKGFLAAFLQTDLTDAPAAHRLYARKGFLAAAKGKMLRLVRFISLPLLDGFLYDHPLATFHAEPGADARQWPLVWSDWITDDALRIWLTGGSCDKDSDGYGPGVSAVDVSAQALHVTAHVSGPSKAAVSETIHLALALSNQSDKPLDFSARLLLPPGCGPEGQWAKTGPVETVGAGQTFETGFDISVSQGLDLEALHYATSQSVPCTIEVFAAGTCFWLTHQVLVDNTAGSAP
jgi:ribosomal protein S18 acetylase RimI-like enzyme